MIGSTQYKRLTANSYSLPSVLLHGRFVRNKSDN
jgi:hypothetical protein